VSAVVHEVTVPIVNSRNSKPIVVVLLFSICIYYFVSLFPSFSIAVSLQKTRDEAITSTKDWIPRITRLIEPAYAPNIIETVPSAIFYTTLNMATPMVYLFYLSMLLLLLILLLL